MDTPSITPAVNQLPVLDGKHYAAALAHDCRGRQYLVFFEPYIAFTDCEGIHHEAGEFYHCGVIYDLDNNDWGRGVVAEYSAKPWRADFIPELLRDWRLDGLDLKWIYQPSAGSARNPLWLEGDGGWLEARRLADLEALRSRTIDAGIENVDRSGLMRIWDTDIVLLPEDQFRQLLAELTAALEERIAAKEAKRKEIETQSYAATQMQGKRRRSR